MAKTLLVVDDDSMNLKMADFILSKNGYIVKKASGGEEALKLLASEPVDMILLDIEMPVMNGFETLEAIQGIDSLKNIPVMFLTASADGDDLKRASEMGAAGYVTKPFIPQNLLEHVEGALA